MTKKLFGLLVFLFLSIHSFNAYADFMSVLSNQAFMHEAPSDSTKKSYIVTKGYPVKVLVSLKEWKKVKDHTGSISWIKSEHLTSKRMVLNLKKNNPIYYGVYSDSPILAFVNENVPLELVEEEDIGINLIKVYSKITDLEGFIHKENLWGIK